MRYKSVFTVTFNADDDPAARRIAKLHHQQLLDELRVEGADHPYEFALERIVAEGRDGPRDLAESERQSI